MISMTKEVFEQLMDAATNKGAKLQFDVGQLQAKLQEVEKENEELKAKLLGQDNAKVPLDKVQNNASKS